jgi:hypothetical protein
MCALSTIVLFIAIIPSMTYIMPAISGVIIWTVVPIVKEREIRVSGDKKACETRAVKWGVLTYAAAAVLSMLIVPEKEAMTYFILIFGYYPILRGYFHKITFIPAMILTKLLFFNAAAVLSFTIVVNMFVAIEQVMDGLEDFGKYAIYILLLMGNAAFFFYDFALKYIYYAFDNWIKPVLNKKLK